MKRPVMTRTLACLGATFLAGCLNTVTIAASPDASAPSTNVDVETPHDSGSIGDRGEALPSSCAATRCAAGEQCCLTTGRCFDPRVSTGQCSAPAQDSSPQRTCASDADCAESEFCRSDQGLCLGAGHCASRDACGECITSIPGACTVCGCDGVNYPNSQTACRLGVRAVESVGGACGGNRPGSPDAGFYGDGGTARIPCANSTHCPAAQSCCAITGVCFETGCSACCRQPPPGTSFPCITNAQCRSDEYCRGEGCDTPGGCVRIPTSAGCGGSVAQVCGCDGRTYVNDCWAAGAGVRVARSGACP